MIDEFLTENFMLREFACKDGSDFPDEVLDGIKELSKELQTLREELGSPIIISSGYRTPEYNKQIGGAKNSYHLKGMASDIWCHNYEPEFMFQIICSLINKGRMKQGGVGCYKTFVHYDTRGYAARKYPGKDWVIGE